MAGTVSCSPLARWLVCGALVFAMTPAHALDADLLSPDLAAFQERLQLAEQLLTAAHSHEVATGDSQNAWLSAVGPRAAYSRVRCTDVVAGGLASNARTHGAAWRSSLQAARVESARVQRMAEADTVAPLVGAGEVSRVLALAPEIARQESTYATTSAWQLRFIERWARGCVLPSPPIAGVSPHIEGSR